jgi:hypothetical protein
VNENAKDHSRYDMSRIDQSNMELTSKEAMDPRKKPIKRYDTLRPFQVWGYGIGHYLNDLIAGIGFVFALYFFVEIEIIDTGNPGRWAGY